MELIFGSMFSGKSTELIRRTNRLKSIGKSILLVNSHKDTRCNDVVKTHDDTHYKAIKINCILELINYKDIDNYEVIAIDEAQFFPDLYKGVKEIWLEGSKELIICGLDGDFKQESFGQILDLIPMATKIDKLYGYCNLCKDKTEGCYSIRKKKENVFQELIGNKEDYMCVCYKHLLEINDFS